MKKIVNQIKKLKKSDLKKEINKKISEFEKISLKKEKVFSELCYCLLTANFTAEKSLKIQKQLKSEFCFLSEKRLALKLKERGHRFPNKRAQFIFNSRKFKNIVFNKIKADKKKKKGKEIREFLIKNIFGLGMKESSHFLRNIGYKNLAIIDFHILNLLNKEKIINYNKKSLSKKKYLEIEEILKNIAKKTKIDLARLDLYLWFIETGKILK